MRTLAPTPLLIICLFAPPAVIAQDTTSATGGTLPEEVVVTGERSLVTLRTRMQQAEVQAYDIFNRFNDETRFDIQCSTHQPTGTRIKQQVCSPRFQAEATAVTARGMWETLRDHLDLYTVEGTTQNVYMNAETRIASQMEDYRSKLRQIADEHPEFLDALIKYTQARQQYEEATTPQSRNLTP